ncbi:hypothetical protein PISMIDRAFT_10533 [Pisolithus microcarpus 441]|uniref:Uncharacterized protein n=1 Tax=Pisolithus microcarpus 441 TaxID=765257 RepID=A0A0C9ZDB8_9AGAM|nr:hypothetical protein PISMIDRAFT_10533 [Pisolithus microcarpus 441]
MTTRLRSRSLAVEALEQAAVSDLHHQFRSFSARGTPSPVTPRAGDEPDGNNPGGDDPGDDDPHNNDEDDEDDNDPFVDAPEDLDPQLAVLQNLATAVDRLSRSTRCPDDTSSSRAKV